MRLEIIFPGEAALLYTTNIQTVYIRTGSARRYAGRNAKIRLIYNKSNATVPGTQKDSVQPDSMAGTDYLNGVRIDEEGSAMFKVKILALSSQHQNQEFRFEVVVDTSPVESIKSAPFRTLSKVHRKRKLSFEHVEADLLETLAHVFEDPSFLTNDMLGSILITHKAILEKTNQVTKLQCEIGELNRTLAKQLSQISIMRYTPTTSTNSLDFAISAEDLSSTKGTVQKENSIIGDSESVLLEEDSPSGEDAMSAQSDWCGDCLEPKTLTSNADQLPTDTP